MQYIVRRGDTLSAIAQRFNLPLITLTQINNITNPNLISEGQVLTIPEIAQAGVNGQSFVNDLVINFPLEDQVLSYCFTFEGLTTKENVIVSIRDNRNNIIYEEEFSTTPIGDNWRQFSGAVFSFRTPAASSGVLQFLSNDSTVRIPIRFSPEVLADSPIIILFPQPNQAFSDFVRVIGKARVFEASVNLRVRNQAGGIISETFTTATQGAPCWGVFAKDIPIQGHTGTGSLEIFTISSATGEETNKITIPIRFR